MEKSEAAFGFNFPFRRLAIILAFVFIQFAGGVGCVMSLANSEADPTSVEQADFPLSSA